MGKQRKKAGLAIHEGWCLCVNWRKQGSAAKRLGVTANVYPARQDRLQGILARSDSSEFPENEFFNRHPCSQQLLLRFVIK